MSCRSSFIRVSPPLHTCTGHTQPSNTYSWVWYNHQQCLPRGRALGPCSAVAWAGRAAGRRGPLGPHRCSPRWGRTAPHQNHQGTPQSTTLGPAAISYTITLLFCLSAPLIGPSLRITWRYHFLFTPHFAVSSASLFLHSLLNNDYCCCGFGG